MRSEKKKKKKEEEGCLALTAAHGARSQKGEGAGGGGGRTRCSLQAKKCWQGSTYTYSFWIFAATILTEERGACACP